MEGTIETNNFLAVIVFAAIFVLGVYFAIRKK